VGIGDFIKDLTPDSVEDAVEDGVEWAGNRVEDVGNWTADRLDDVGWESGADWVREKSRSVANRMGAEVDEMDLGQTEDKTKLIYGSPGKLRSTAAHLRDFQRAFDNVGLGLEGLDSDTLKGQAADAFRATVKIEPPRWYKGADAFEEAAKALDAFAGTVTWAQDQAQTAIDKWKAGTEASEKAADAHKSKVDSYNKAVDQYNAKPADQRAPSQLPPKPGEFTDPGKQSMQEAQDILAEARRQRNAAAETARGAVTHARDAAPPKPSYAEQAQDGLDEYELMKTHFGAGILKGTAGLVNFARGLNPTDPYNITHPAEYLTNLDSTVAGLVTVANDPWGAGKQMVTDFMKDPAEGLGTLVPDAVLAAATGGAGAGVKGARLAEEAADAANAARRAEGLADDAEGAGRRADDMRDPARPPNCKCSGREPVDFATGRMFLPQVDVDLPGSLPLVLRRDYESSYRAGRWFGPTWSSTIDQRLEVDAIGVVLHGHSGTARGRAQPPPRTPPGRQLHPHRPRIRSDVHLPRPRRRRARRRRHRPARVRQRPRRAYRHRRVRRRRGAPRTGPTRRPATGVHGPRRSDHRVDPGRRGTRAARPLRLHRRSPHVPHRLGGAHHRVHVRRRGARHLLDRHQRLPLHVRLRRAGPLCHPDRRRGPSVLRLPLLGPGPRHRPDHHDRHRLPRPHLALPRQRTPPGRRRAGPHRRHRAHHPRPPQPAALPHRRAGRTDPFRVRRRAPARLGHPARRQRAACRL
jgi:hypothetical protein